MRVLIIGAAGMLGTDVLAAAGAAGLEPIALTVADLDITDGDAVERTLRDVRPAAVVNCAGWTDVDGAESEPEAAHAVNGTGAGNVARAAALVDAWTVHVSTDYVFDGTKSAPYVESDPTAPLSAYGRSKLAGEVEVARQAPESHTTVRSSWLFGGAGRCFPATILNRCREAGHARVVDDQVGCPTFTGHLAGALVELATVRRPLGIVHVAGGGSCSWFEFAKEIVEQANLDCEVSPCATEEMPRPARRPAHSVLGTERGDEIPSLPPWRAGLEEYLAVRTPAA